MHYPRLMTTEWCDMTGQSHRAGDDFEQIALIPACLQPLVLDPDLRRPLLLQQIHRDMPQHHEVCRARPLSRSALIPPKGDVQHPVHPMLNGLISTFPIWPQ